MSHKYRDNPRAFKEICANVLVESWSYSKLGTFSRNEKAFEMNYIYCESFKSSASSVAGNAYHEALRFYFNEMKAGRRADIVSLQQVAFKNIDEIKANRWKLQKTTPTIEECKKKATVTCSKALENFFSEISIYLSHIKEILHVEIYIDEFVTINGVDIPIPCHCIIDFVFLTYEDKRVVLDHKLKVAFSDEKELQFSIGKQALTYVNCYEEHYGEQIDEVWFMENKISTNRDGSKQLSCFKMELTKDMRALYESLLYEPLKRMLEAISNPDYVYLINEADNFVDKAEIYEFWARTQMAEVDDFVNIPISKREMILGRLRKIRNSSLGIINPKAIQRFRANASEFIQFDLTNKNMSKSEKIEHILRTLQIMVSVKHKIEGYSSDTFLLEVTAGTSISQVQRFKLDIANALNVSSIRIMKDLYVYEEKAYLAIEATKPRERDLMFDPSHLEGFRIPIGVDNFGNTVVWDMENPSTPHVLICGSTGSGKSVCIMSILEYAKMAGMDEIVIFDLKYEFGSWKAPDISVLHEIEDIETVMELMVEQMNELIKSGTQKKTLIIFDEFADAVLMARKGKDLDTMEMVQVGEYAPKKGTDGKMLPAEPKMKRQSIDRKKSLLENLQSLLQKGRSSGYRIIAATQRASVKVITGDIKVNLPVQICFKVPKEVDSKVVIDEGGAEALAGKGDGLIQSPEYQGIVRFQAFCKA